MDSAAPVQFETLSPPRLEVQDVAEHRVVHLNGHCIAVYPRTDRLTERILATQLVEVSELQARWVAEAFGIHEVTLSRWRSLARTAGAEALVPQSRGPKAPSKRTPALERKILRLRQQGLSYRAIAQRLSRPGAKISHALVATVLQEQQASQPQVLPGVEMVSAERLLGAAPPLEEVARILAGHFGDIFERDLVEVSAASLADALAPEPLISA